MGEVVLVVNEIMVIRSMVVGVDAVIMMMIIRVMVRLGKRLNNAGVIFLLDEHVDDAVLHGVHHGGEQEHDKHDLRRHISLVVVVVVVVISKVEEIRHRGGHVEDPIADFDNHRILHYQHHDARFHQQQRRTVDQRLLQPPRLARRAAVVAGLDRFRRVAERCKRRGIVEESQDDNQDRDADGRLDLEYLQC